MSKILYIKANPKPEGESRTFTVSDAFIETYKKTILKTRSLPLICIRKILIFYLSKTFRLFLAQSQKKASIIQF